MIHNAIWREAAELSALAEPRAGPEPVDFQVRLAALAALLDQPHMSVRLQVVRALGLGSDANAQDALLLAARTEDLELRAQIAAALSLHDPEAAIPR